MWMFLIVMTTLPFGPQPDIRLEIVESENYKGKVFFFSPHEDEHVVNTYLAQKIQKEGGRHVILRQNGNRNLDLVFKEGTVQVDPNRIFTRVGAAASLLDLNEGLKEDSKLYQKALDRAVAVADFIRDHIGQYQKDTTIVTIHNNKKGYRDDGVGGRGTISMKRYAKKQEGGARYIKALHHGDHDEDDLFFITSPKHFEIMKKDGWNLVLQHPDVAHLPDEDDGSLSVLAEMKGLDYLNIEAQRQVDGMGRDHLAEQSAMVDYIYKLLKP